MRKVDDGEKKKRRRRKEKNDVFSGHYVIASRPPERQPTGMPHARANISETKYNSETIWLSKQMGGYPLSSLIKTNFE